MNARADIVFTIDPDAYAEAVDARITALMAPGAKFWPIDPDNLAEALGETLAAHGKSFTTKLAAALAGDSRSALGCDLMRKESEAYWLKPATEQAEAEIKAEQQDAADLAMEHRAERGIWHAAMVNLPELSRPP